MISVNYGMMYMSPIFMLVRMTTLFSTQLYIVITKSFSLLSYLNVEIFNTEAAIQLINLIN